MAKSHAPLTLRGICPAQDGAYLSNMCTAPEHRRLGYGAHMLTAAEHLTRMTAYRKIYLHNRRAGGPVVLDKPLWLSRGAW